MASQRNASSVAQETPAVTQETPAEDTQKTLADNTQETPADKQETPAENTQETPAEDTQETPADKQETPADTTQEIPDEENPYAGLTAEQKEVRILEEEASEVQLKYKLAMDAANSRKAEIAKQQKLLDDYYALIALVTAGDETLAASLAVNKQAIITCLQEQRIRIGAPQPIAQHGSIGLHSSSNGSKVIDGSLVPEKREVKMTPANVAQARYEYDNKLATTTELAARYGVQPGYMGNILSGRRGGARA